MLPSHDPSPRPLRTGFFTAALTHTLGVGILILTPLALLALLYWRANQDAPIDIVFVGRLLLGLIAGVCAGALLLNLATNVRLLCSRAQSEKWSPNALRDADQSTQYPGHPPSAWAEDVLNSRGEPRVTLSERTANDLICLLNEMQELSLAAPDEREAVRARVLAGQQRRAARGIIDALNRRQLGLARDFLEDARATYGDTATLSRLAERIDAAATRNEPFDYARTKRLVEEAIGESRWTDAEWHAHALYVEHPDAVRCRKLWEDTRRARLHAHVQQCVEKRFWQEALAAAEEFIERFPDSAEAAMLRTQLVTLRDNAEIQQRQLYERRFRALLETRNFAGALKIARLVVERFPSSPQATALRDQIPSLEKRVAT
jgi:hypothetical protein